MEIYSVGAMVSAATNTFTPSISGELSPMSGLDRTAQPANFSIKDVISDGASQLLEIGVNVLKNSFSQAVGQFAGPLQSIQDEIENGLSNIILAIDEGMQDAGFGSIEENFGKIKDIVSQVFEVIVKAVPPTISFLTKLVEVVGEIINAITPFLPLLLPIITAWASFKVADKFEDIKQSITGIPDKIGGLWTLFNKHPLAIIIGAVIGLIAAFIYFYNTNEEFRNNVLQIWQAIVDFIQPVVTAIATFIQSIFETLSIWWNENQQTILLIVTTVWGAIQAVFELVLLIITNVVETFLAWLQAAWEIGTAIVSVIIQAAWAIISNIFEGALNAILSVVEFVINQIKLVIETVMKIIQSIINIVLSVIRGDWDGVLQGILGIVTAFGGFISGTFENIMNVARELIQTGIDTIKGIFESLSQINLLEMGKAIIDGFVNGLKGAWESGKKFVSGIADWIREHKGPIQKDRKLLIPAGLAIMQSLNAGLQNGFGQVQSNVSSMGDRLASTLNTDYSLGIGDNIVRVNDSINGEVAHNVNYQTNKRPATFNINIGNQTFKAFVSDIAEVMGGEAEVNLNF